MARRGGPVLLEIVQRGNSASADRARPQPPARAWRWPKRPARADRPAREPVTRTAPDDAPGADWWASLPRIVRLPIGYVFVAGAAVLAMVIVGYYVGYKRAEAQLFAQQRDIAARGLESAVEDPLLMTTPLNPGLLAEGAASATNQTRTQPQPQQPRTQPAASGAQSAPAPAPGVDPRIDGMNYFIVMRDTAAEAERAADYLRQNGVEALSVEIPRSQLRHVVALKGFESDRTASTEAREFKARLQALGRAWRRDHRGATDWSDCYLARYTRGS